MPKTLVRACASSLLCLCLLCLLPVRAAAWGSAGHRIIARVALWRLKQMHATNALQHLLQMHAADDDGIADAAVWPDNVRHNFPYTFADNWHFVDIQKNNNAFQPGDCAAKVQAPQTPPKQSVNDCVLGGLAYSRAALLNDHVQPQLRYEAFKFILHFVGDLHQPMHDADDHDLGGNGKFVCFFGKCFDPEKSKPPRNENMHSMWDTYMISHQMHDKWPKPSDMSQEEYDKLAEGKYVDTLEETISHLSPAQLAAVEGQNPQADVLTWVNDAHLLAKNNAYGMLPHGTVSKFNPYDQQSYHYYDIPPSYYQQNIKVVDEQLIKASLRLAAYLRQMYPDGH